MARNINKKEKPKEEARTSGQKKADAAEQSADAGANRTPMLIGALVAVLLIGFALWQLGFFAGAPAKPIDKTNNTKIDQLSTPQAALLSALINKTQNIPTTYQARYIESADETVREIVVGSDGNWSMVMTQNPIYTRTYFWAYNQTVLCENNNEGMACAALNESDDNWAEAQMMREMTFPKNNQSEQIWESYKQLINSGQFEFVGETQEKSIGGRMCREITYQFGENNITVCMDSRYGVVLSQSMTYNQPYQKAGSEQIYYRKASYKIEAVEIGFADQWIEAPVVEIKDKAIGMAKTDDEKWAALQECQSMEGAAKSRCLKDNAIGFNNVRFCEQNQNSTALGDCVIKVATQSGKLKPELCEKAGEMKSECYANIAYLKKDSSYCRLVSDAELRSACDKALEEAAGGQ